MWPIQVETLGQTQDTRGQPFQTNGKDVGGCGCLMSVVWTHEENQMFPKGLFLTTGMVPNNIKGGGKKMNQDVELNDIVSFSV